MFEVNVETTDESLFYLNGYVISFECNRWLETGEYRYLCNFF